MSGHQGGDSSGTRIAESKSWMHLPNVGDDLNHSVSCALVISDDEEKRNLLGEQILEHRRAISKRDVVSCDPSDELDEAFGTIRRYLVALHTPTLHRTALLQILLLLMCVDERVRQPKKDPHVCLQPALHARTPHGPKTTGIEQSTTETSNALNAVRSRHLLFSHPSRRSILKRWLTLRPGPARRQHCTGLNQLSVGENQ